VAAVRRVEAQDVLGEVELDLHSLAAGVHERRGESSDGHVERNLPPVVDHRLQGEAELAHHLGPQVQRLFGLLPVGQGQLRPRFISKG
jgi:hypothetical protein